MMSGAPAGMHFEWCIDTNMSALDAALTYVAGGAQPVFLHGVASVDEKKCTCSHKEKCRSQGKHPVLNNWASNIAKEEIAVRDQFARIKVAPANVGLVLGGQPSGDYLIAIDVDNEDRLDHLTGEFGTLPKTPRCDSGRGYRLFYKLPTGIPTDRLKNVTGIGGESGVDAKVKGGQVVVAPSLHVNGKRYAWVEDSMGALADLPMTWVDGLIAEPLPPPFARDYTPETIRADDRAKRKLERYLEKAVIEECSRLARLPEGQRNTYLHRKAISLLSLVNGCFIPARWAYVLSELDRAARAAGLDAREVRKTLTSAENFVSKSGATRGPRPIVVDPTPISSPPSAPASGAPPSSPPPTDPPDPGAAAPGPPPPPPPPASLLIILIQDRGQNAAITENVARLLSHHSDWNGGPRHDRYSDMIYWPKDRPTMLVPGGVLYNGKIDRSAIQAWCLQHFSMRVGLEIADEGVRIAARRKWFDSLIEWVNSIPPWDGKPRLDRWLHTYCGCKDNAYYRTTGRSWLRGCIERALQPGLLVDIVPILVGNQKTNKNYAIETLFQAEVPEAPWMTIMGKFDPDSLSMKRHTTTRWIIHDDEFKAKDLKLLDRLKSWVSMTDEQYLAKFEMDFSVKLRRALLICSTNDEQMLYDSTGNRRWIPWRFETVDIEALKRDRLQLFAEAKQSVSWRDGLDWELIERHTSVAEVSDPLRERLLRLVTELVTFTDGSKKPRWEGWISQDELCEMIGVSPEKADQLFAVRLGKAVSGIKGWTRRTGRGAGCIRFYRAPDPISAEQVRKDLHAEDD